MSGIWPGTGLETFLLSCAMPLMIHNFLEPWCRCTIVPIYPGLLTLSFLLFHVFFYLQIIFFYFLEFYTETFRERSNSGWVFLLLVVLLLFFYFFRHCTFSFYGRFFFLSWIPCSSFWHPLIIRTTADFFIFFYLTFNVLKNKITL